MDSEPTSLIEVFLDKIERHRGDENTVFTGNFWFSLKFHIKSASKLHIVQTSGSSVKSVFTKKRDGALQLHFSNSKRRIKR